MKICILNEHFGMGGLERVSSVIGKGLSKDYEVFYYSMFSKENFFNIENNFVIGKLSHKLKWLNPSNYGRKLEFILRKKETTTIWYRKEIDTLITWINNTGIDILIISSPLIISFIPKIQNRSKVKCIAWLHNNYDTYINDYTSKYSICFKEGLSKADGVVCLTNYDLEKFKKFNSKIQCIYNPLTIDHKVKADLDTKNISFTGRLSFDHKGIDYLIDIAKNLPNNWTITIAGDGTENQINKLGALIAINNLSKKLIFLGPLSGIDLINHYKNSSFYIMTSRWEGMPLVLAEAMSFGLPILAFRQSGSSEVLNDGEYGILIEQGNVDKMSKMILRLTNSKDLRIKYSGLSEERIEYFNLDSILNQWKKLIESIN